MCFRASLWQLKYFEILIVGWERCTVDCLIMMFDDFRRVEYTHKNTSCSCPGRKLWTDEEVKSRKKSSSGSSDRRRLFYSSLRRNRLQALFCHCSKLRWINHICMVTLALSSMEPGTGRRGLMALKFVLPRRRLCKWYTVVIKTGLLFIMWTWAQICTKCKDPESDQDKKAT